MNTLHKRLVLNKREDWLQSLSANIFMQGDQIVLSEGRVHGYICRASIDSGEKSYLWGRVTLDCSLPPDSLIRAYAYAADTKLFDGGADLDAFISERNGEDANVRRMLTELFTPVGSSEDFYVNLSGRYLWLLFEFMSAGASPCIEKVHVHISGDHMVDYLPAIYCNGVDFTKRFLSVFDSAYMDMEARINDLSAKFDYENTDLGMLRYLAQWVCLDAEGLGEETLRERIRTAIEDYEGRYTLKGIIQSVERLTGKVPRIIESFEVDPNNPAFTNATLYRRLYGENPHKFFILLHEDTFKSRAQIERFMERMRMRIPADTEFELVLLKPCTQLDWHTYLGINAVVRNYVPMVIDESTTIHYDMMIGGGKSEGDQHISN